MDFAQVMACIKATGFYSPRQWQEYLSRFEPDATPAAALDFRAAGNPIVNRIIGEGYLGLELDTPVSPKLITIDGLARLRAEEDLVLGAVSGCYDLLHLGHLDGICYAGNYMHGMERGALCAFVLPDMSVRQKKGPMRPVLKEEERLMLLSHVKALDYVALLEGPDCLQMIIDMRPEFFFKDTYDLGQPIVRDELAVVGSYGGEQEFFPALA